MKLRAPCCTKLGGVKPETRTGFCRRERTSEMTSSELWKGSLQTGMCTLIKSLIPERMDALLLNFHGQSGHIIDNLQNRWYKFFQIQSARFCNLRVNEAPPYSGARPKFRSFLLCELQPRLAGTLGS